MTDREALQAARALLTTPGVWCQSAQARYTVWRTKKTGERVAVSEACSALDKYATRWCAAGALVKVTGIAEGPPGLRALQAVTKDLFQEDLGRYNDQRGRRVGEILSLFAVALRGEE